MAVGRPFFEKTAANYVKTERGKHNVHDKQKKLSVTFAKYCIVLAFMWIADADRMRTLYTEIYPRARSRRNFGNHRRQEVRRRSS